MEKALAYFITFTCYGTWLHGDKRGAADRTHNCFGDPFLAADAALHAERRAAMRDPPYRLDEARRVIVLSAIREISVKQGWELLAVHVRGNHVHIVLRADQVVERVMNSLKAAATFRLNKAFPEECRRKRWTRHGSARYLLTDEQVAEKIAYTLDGQGEPMQRYPEPKREPRTERAQRAE